MYTFYWFWNKAGEWDTQTINEPYPHQDRNVMEVVIHEHYKPGSHFNDVALLFLDKPVELAENINTVCLPPQDFNFDHKRCYATGWGKWFLFSLANTFFHCIRRLIYCVLVFLTNESNRQRQIWQRWTLSGDFETNWIARCTKCWVWNEIAWNTSGTILQIRSIIHLCRLIILVHFSFVWLREKGELIRKKINISTNSFIQEVNMEETLVKVI